MFSNIIFCKMTSNFSDNPKAFISFKPDLTEMLLSKNVKYEHLINLKPSMISIGL